LAQHLSRVWRKKGAKTISILFHDGTVMVSDGPTSKLPNNVLAEKDYLRNLEYLVVGNMAMENPPIIDQFFTIYRGFPI